MYDVKTGIRQGDVWLPILFGPMINYELADSVQVESASDAVLLVLTLPKMLPNRASLIPKLLQTYIELNF